MYSDPLPNPDMSKLDSFFEKWSEGALPFLIGVVVTLGMVVVVMITMNLLIVTKLVFPNA